MGYKNAKSSRKQNQMGNTLLFFDQNGMKLKHNVPFFHQIQDVLKTKELRRNRFDIIDVRRPWDLAMVYSRVMIFFKDHVVKCL